MLFLKDQKGEPGPRAVYLLSDDMEGLVAKQIARALGEHGYPTGERAEIIKDMAFMRAKRLLVERTAGQCWSLLVRGVLVAIGALIIIATKEFIRL